MRSFPAILILVWSFFSSTLSIGFSNASTSTWLIQEAANIMAQTDNGDWVEVHLVIGGIIASVLLLYPLAGFVADVYYGRDRVIAAGLLLIWGGSALAFIAGIFANLLPEQASITLSSFSYLLLVVGHAAFEANIIQFGIDQLQGASGEELSVFIHWYVWSKFLGQAVCTVCIVALSCWSGVFSSVVFLIVASGSYTVLLIVSYFARKHLIVINYRGQNAYKTVFQVLNFARQHKQPLRRSALTYCENEPPSRLDLGKEKYGGPFTTEQVEDVKTVLGVLVILFSLGLGFVVMVAASYTIPLFGLHLHALDTHKSHFCDIKALFFDYQEVTMLTVVVLIPISLWIIRPYLARCLPRMLNRLGIGISILPALSVLSIFVIDTVGHTMHQGVPCMFVDRNITSPNSTMTLELDPSLLIVPGVLNGISEILIQVTAFEFIIAQSPQYMKGLLIGGFFAIKGLFTSLGIILILPFHQARIFDKADFPSCGFSYYLLNFLIALLVLVTFIYVSRKYKYRQRDEVSYEHQFAEAYYEQTEETPILEMSFSETEMSILTD